MDCLRSFIVRINQQTNWTGSDVKTWLIGAQYHWAVDAYSSTSTFNIEGFKNVNIYGIQLIGNVITNTASVLGAVVVSDWSFEIEIDGQLPLISGTIAPTNYWAIETSTQATKYFTLSKNTNLLTLADPIASAKNIVFRRLKAQGDSGQTLNNVSLDWDFSFVFFYKYEGE